MGYAAIAGALIAAGGAALQGRANDMKRQRLKKAADEPGLDVGLVTGEALGNQEKYFDRAAGLAGRTSAANQAALLAQEEAALPGAGAARGEALGRIRGLFSDDADWLRGVQRRGAALGLSSGLFGSQAGQLQTLRLSDRESMGRTQLGTSLLGSLIGSLRIANSPGVQAFMGPSASDLVTLREQERRDRQQLMAKAALMPGQTEAWGSYLTDTGGALMGGGFAGGFGGGGGQAKPQTSYSGSSTFGYGENSQLGYA